MPVIVLNSFGAVRNASPSLVQMCRSFLGTRWQQITKIILPDAAPVIFAGLRLGVAAGFIGVVLAELLITPTGIGDLITYYRSHGRLCRDVCHHPLDHRLLRRDHRAAQPGRDPPVPPESGAAT